MTTANLKRARQAFTAILGQDCVLDEGTAQAHYGTDTTGARRRLAGALRPATGDAIAPIVEVARMQGVALHPISTGRNWGYGTALAVLDDVFILDLSQLKRILDFDAELGTVTVEPGVTQGMLAEYLDQHAPEFLVPVTGAGPGASLMGNALERGFGFTRNSDHASAILSLEAVLPDGRVYRSAMAEMGGSRVDRLYRWGIGPYFEGLFAQNGFGIVTQVTLALARRPAAYGSLLFFVEDDQLEAAVQACREILSTLPGIVPSMKFMNETMVMASTIPYPHHLVAPGDVMPPTLRSSLSRSASIPPWSGYITLYGTHATVKAARREIRRQLKRVATRMVFMSPSRIRLLSTLSRCLPQRFRSKIEGVVTLLSEAMRLVGGRPTTIGIRGIPYWRVRGKTIPDPQDPAREGGGVIWYSPLVPLTPRDVRAFATMVQEILPQYGLEPAVNFSALSERIFDATIPLMFDPADPNATERAQAAYRHLLEAGRARGYIPYRLGVDGMAWLETHAPNAMVLAHRLGAAVGGGSVIDPGRYGPARQVDVMGQHTGSQL